MGPEKDGNNCRRGFIGTKPVIITRGCDDGTDQVCMVMHSLNNVDEEGEKLMVFLRGLAGESRFSLVSVASDQLLCFPDPFTPL